MRKTLILASIMLASALYAEKIEFFEKIEFRGARNLDRYRVIQQSRARADNKGIVIDTDSLKDVLDKTVIVKSSSLSREGSTLIVEVEEKYPLFMALMVDKQQSVPALLDEKMNIVESGLFFRTDMPIIILTREFADSEQGQRTVTGLFELLKTMGGEKRGFINELAEVKFDSPADLKVKMKKRKTLFAIKNELNGFVRLEKTAAYLDGTANYPDFLDLRGSMALIR